VILFLRYLASCEVLAKLIYRLSAFSCFLICFVNHPFACTFILTLKIYLYIERFTQLAQIVKEKFFVSLNLKSLITAPYLHSYNSNRPNY